MEVRFATNELERCFSSVTAGTRAWGPVVARKYVQRVNTLLAAHDQRDLYGLRSLRIHQLAGRRPDRWAATLHGPWRLELSFEDDAVVVQEVSNHYGD